MTRLQFSTLPLVCALVASGVLTQTAATAQTLPGHSMVSAAELKWVDLPSLPPGAKIAILEGPMNEAVPFPRASGFRPSTGSPAHWHPAIERVSVLSGTFYMGVGEVFDVSKGMTVPTGGFAVMQAKAPHFAYTMNEPVEIQLYGMGPWGITYLNPADDPRKKQPQVRPSAAAELERLGNCCIGLRQQLASNHAAL